MTTTSSTRAKSTQWTPVPDIDKLTILKMFAEGRNPTFVAAATKYSEARVRQVATAHGYPDPDKLAWAVDVVIANVEQAERDRVTEAGPVPQTRATSVPRTPTAPAPTPAPSPSSVPRPAPSAQDRPRVVDRDVDDSPAGAPTADSVRWLIARGGKSQRARTKRLAEKVAAAVDALERALQVEEETRRAAAEAAQAKSRERAARAAQERKIREELEELEKRRAELRRQLRPTAPSRPAPAPREVDPKKVRQWARTNGVPVPAAGRVSVRVVEQYLAASTKAA